MARLSFFFARCCLILSFLLQIFVSGTHAFHCDDDGFDCHSDEDDEDPATRQRNQIIAASVVGGGLLLTAIVYFIYEYRKPRIRAQVAPLYTPYQFAGAPATFAPPLGPPPLVHPAQGRPHAYTYGYGYNGQPVHESKLDHEDV
ncbi:hypothetical protein B0H16DRAFT_1500251 [Mycena metata]|uniref:Transmembrane protein n=1 Tax=Mycena metata TaxID=1033252 RepID=A0AAD7K7P6_9AGAR|nr:hypothetical protein B0H16DRAFT_1500251 [Mycena metata]